MKLRFPDEGDKWTPVPCVKFRKTAACGQLVGRGRVKIRNGKNMKTYVKKQGGGKHWGNHVEKHQEILLRG